MTSLYVLGCIFYEGTSIFDRLSTLLKYHEAENNLNFKMLIGCSEWFLLNLEEPHNCKQVKRNGV